jgi:hypothetical protein
MPTFVHGKGTAVYLDEFEMTDYFNSADVAITNDTAEVTAYGATSKSYLLGLADGTLSLSGMWTADTDATDEELHAILGSASAANITIAEAAGTIGNRATIARCDEVNYSISNPVADVSTVTADFQGTSNSGALGSMTYGVTAGVQLSTGTAIDYNALGNLAGVDAPLAASSSAGGAGLLHVPVNSISGGTTTIKVQHDSASDFSSAADLISFTAVGASAKTSEMVVCSGTVNRYIRATASTAGSSGSITFMVTFARF